MVKVVVIAGTHSGVGKTSLSVGLMLALRQNGLKVQPFKVGPDFLDPIHHVAACGRESINLDGWMLNKQQVLDSFHRHTADADVAVVEGVMGLFDSRDGISDDGSTAQIAKWLGAPVLLVVDCCAMARSAAALVKGYAEFDPEMQLCGVLLNKVGSAGHGVWLAEALAAAWQQQRLQKQVKVLGCIPKDDSVAVPERYLGLTMPHEQADQQQGQDSSAEVATAQQQSASETGCSSFVPPYLTRLAQHVSQHVDLDLLLELAVDVQLPATDILQQQSPTELSTETSLGQSVGPGASAALVLKQQPRPAYKCRIAVARDEAFCFYYQDNLSLLTAAGAELVMFSPLRSIHLPGGISGIYLGGGYPERSALQLSNNTSLLSEVRHWASSGGVVYAECGGLIYLCQGFEPPAAQNPAGSTGIAGNASNSSSSGSRTSGSTPSTAAGTGTAAGTPTSSSSSNSLIPLVGLLPFKVCMGSMKMGYVEVEVLPGNPLFPAGAHVRGQVYHFSQVEPCSLQGSASNSHVAGLQLYGTDCSSDSTSRHNSSSISTRKGVSCCKPSAQAPTAGSSEHCEPAAVQHTYSLLQVLPGAQPTLEGYAVGNVLASYVHLHWGGCPHLAAALVDKCCSSGVTNSSAVTNSNAADSSSSRREHTANDSCTAFSSGSREHTAYGSCTAGSSGSREHTTNGRIQPSHCSFCQPNGLESCPITNSNPYVTSIGTSSSSSKIVSLLPSGTEGLYALGLQDRLVGVSGFCDWPPEARTKPSAVTSLIDVDSMSSDEIEAAVQAFKASGQSPFKVNADLLTLHQPGLVLTQDACKTCDADHSLVCRTLHEAGLNPNTTQVLVLHPETLYDVLRSIRAVGAAAGVADRAKQLVDQLQARLHAVGLAVQARSPAIAAETVARATVHIFEGRSAEFAARAQQLPLPPVPPCKPGLARLSGGAVGNTQGPGAVTQPPQDQQQHQRQQQQQDQQEPQTQQQQQQGLQRVPQGLSPWQRAPRVLSLEGLNPLVLGGQWLPDVKLAAGAVDAARQSPGDAPHRITWEMVRAWAPEVLLLCPCSRSPAAAMPDVERLVAQPGFRDLPAVASGSVYLIDHSYFSRPGPRLVDGVELLYHLLWELPHGHDRTHALQQQQQLAVTDPVAGMTGGAHSMQGAYGACVTNRVVAEGAESGSVVGAGVGGVCSWRHDVLRIQWDAVKNTFQWVPL